MTIQEFARIHVTHNLLEQKQDEDGGFLKYGVGLVFEADAQSGEPFVMLICSQCQIRERFTFAECEKAFSFHSEEGHPLKILEAAFNAIRKRTSSTN